MTRLYKCVFMLAGISVSGLMFSDQIQPLLDVGQARQVAEKTSQSKIDEMDDQTSVIVSEFKTVSKQIEGLRVYNAQMKQQIQRQEERLKEIDKTMKEAQIMQRQIPPFLKLSFFQNFRKSETPSIWPWHYVFYILSHIYIYRSSVYA